MGEMVESNSIMGAGEDSGPECQCFTKLHFTNKNICIQDLRPNHYDSTFCGIDIQKESKFVTNIMESKFYRERTNNDFLITLSEIENVKNIFDEIKLGFKDDDEVGGSNSKLQPIAK